MGHKVEGEKAGYLDRLNPYKAFMILNSIEFENEINFNLIKETTNNFYEERTELEWITEEYIWNTISRVKPTNGRRV